MKMDKNFSQVVPPTSNDMTSNQIYAYTNFT